MKSFSPIVIFIFSFGLCVCEEPCNIDIDCDDCLPENFPSIHSHILQNNILTIPHGEEVHFHCQDKRFLNYPNKNSIKALCEDGNYRVIDDNLIAKHISELSCDADYYDDVLHDVDYCRDPFQGRSYQYRNSSSMNVKHLLEICYDADMGRTVFAHMTFSNGNNIVRNEHVDDQNKLSIFGNFNKMFDKSNKIEAEKVYDNNVSMNKIMKLMMGKHKFNFVDQILVATKLLPNSFFLNQNGRVTKFVSNKAAVWRSISNGNLRNLHNDIIAGFKRNEMNNQSIEVFVGTHDVLSLQVSNQYKEMYLKPIKKYPIAKYIWNIIYHKNEHKAAVLVVINNPFLSLSEIKNSVFCPSMCNALSWIKNLKHTNNYERTAYGIVFCCDVHSFVRVVNHSPNILPYVHVGEKGLLKDALP